MQPTRRRRMQPYVRPLTVLGILAVATAALVIAPVGAHTTTPGHIWNKHIKPKTDNRYDQSKVATSTADSNTASNAFVDVPGAAQTIQIPRGGGKWRVTARFDAESVCSGADGSWCSVQILIGGQPGNPDDGFNYAFDSPGDTPGADWEGHSLSRSRVLGPGMHEVKVQFRVVGATDFRLDDWHLSVETLRRA